VAVSDSLVMVRCPQSEQSTPFSATVATFAEFPFFATVMVIWATPTEAEQVSGLEPLIG
jgi:hypothetical protein